jgi:hypothetical protein
MNCVLLLCKRFNAASYIYYIIGRQFKGDAWRSQTEWEKQNEIAEW